LSALSPDDARAALERLYRETVLEHYRNPRNRTPLAAPQGRALVDNPVCGDQVRVEVKLADGRIAEISSVARGCSIAVASGSVMTELVRGLDREQSKAFAQALADLVHARPVPEDLVPKLRAFARVAELPSRRRCAMLAWEALDEALKEAGS
jgi:nitrogen fixation protein NifU and related proteins